MVSRQGALPKSILKSFESARLPQQTLQADFRLLMNEDACATEKTAEAIQR